MGGGPNAIADCIKKAFGELHRAGHGSAICFDCGDLLTSPSLFTADTGEAFEALSQSAIEEAICKLFERATNKYGSIAKSAGVARQAIYRSVRW